MSARIWLEKAHDARLMVQAALELNLGDWACFLSHQIAEFALKAVLTLHQGDCPQTHSIENLLAKCMRYDRGFVRFSDRAGSVSQMYLAARYINAPGVPPNVSHRYSASDAVETFAYAEEILALAQAQFPSES